MSNEATLTQRIDRVAQERFGYTELYPGQRTAIEQILAGRDTLAVMPTGAGKSAIYQIAGCLLPGGTVVVSPLIALQHDQVQSLEGLAVGGAVAVNSTKGEPNPFPSIAVSPTPNGAKDWSCAMQATNSPSSLILSVIRRWMWQWCRRISCSNP